MPMVEVSNGGTTDKYTIWAYGDNVGSAMFQGGVLVPSEDLSRFTYVRYTNGQSIYPSSPINLYRAYLNNRNTSESLILSSSWQPIPASLVESGIILVTMEVRGTSYGAYSLDIEFK